MLVPPAPGEPEAQGCNLARALSPQNSRQREFSLCDPRIGVLHGSLLGSAWVVVPQERQPLAVTRAECQS